MSVFAWMAAAATDIQSLIPQDIRPDPVARKTSSEVRLGKVLEALDKGPLSLDDLASAIGEDRELIRKWIHGRVGREIKALPPQASLLKVFYLHDEHLPAAWAIRRAYVENLRAQQKEKARKLVDAGINGGRKRGQHDGAQLKAMREILSRGPLRAMEIIDALMRDHGVTYDCARARIERMFASGYLRRTQVAHNVSIYAWVERTGSIYS